jgi:hypothetical protein
MSAAPQRKQPASEGDQLMREMGSTKGFDPIPPDQYLTYQDTRYSPGQRLEAWMRSKTIRYGHRSPNAVDEHGNELYLKHAAADLKMDPGNVGRAWRNLEAEGRVRMEGRRLYLCGTVALPQEKKKRSLVCIDNYPPYIARQIKHLAPESREKLLAAEQEDQTRIEKMLAESAAGWRAIFDQRQDSRFSEFGIKKIRERKRREVESPFVPVFREFLEKACADNLSPALLVCNTPKNGHMQTTASLLSSETEKRLTAAAAFSPLVEGGRNGHAEEQDAAATAPLPPPEPQTPDPGDPDPWNEPSLLPWTQTIAAMRERFPGLGYAAAEKLASLVEATDAEIACAVRLINQRRKFRSEGLYFKAARDFIAEARKLTAAEEEDRVRTERMEAGRRAEWDREQAEMTESMRARMRDPATSAADRAQLMRIVPELAAEFGGDEP